MVCTQLATIDDLNLQFDVKIIISTIHVEFSVYKQQCSYMNRSMVSCNLYLVCHESWNINSKWYMFDKPGISAQTIVQVD